MNLKIFQYLKQPSGSGMILLIAAIAALILCNSPWSSTYQNLFTQHVLFWINEGLMSLFFLGVGLELKHELTDGHLSSLSQVSLPLVAALGGMLVPGLLYVLINFEHPVALQGWPVPVATDIAFALGILSLVGKRVPPGLKIFLMALAIFDDIGAILIIAISHQGDWGVHATVASVLIGAVIPLKLGKRLEKKLRPWVLYLVMPLFAFANAGLQLHAVSWSILFSPVVAGIVAGLFLGKQLGIVSFAWLLVRLGLAKLPAHTTWFELYGVAILCGIGFTMSLFLGTLAFQENNAIYLMEVRLGVLIASLLSGIMGAIILQMAFFKKAIKVEEVALGRSE